MLTEDSFLAITKQAIVEYPSECCGMVTGSASTQRVHPCRNRQDELHASDSERHPRTSREAYDIDRREMERIFAAAKAANEQVIAFYHSHIDCGAYFSRMDKEVLTVLGEPELPEAVHIVVSVQDRQIKEMRGYKWNGEKRDFAQMAVW